ncbi:MAG: coproporphyrinogen dehydrogenase HemZ [Eubacteriales bacterium]|nr:coproporphyrinogen dehydrogenase HemZ [Eubacteriales bacterium]
MKKLCVFVNSKNKNELMEMVRAFEPYVDFRYDEIAENADEFFYEDKIYADSMEISVSVAGYRTALSYKLPEDTLENKKYARRFGKNAIYTALKKYSGEHLPYGSLTGVRPTKLYAELMKEGVDAYDEFINVFDVTPEKTEHVRRIVNNQKDLLNIGENEVDVFVNIPFCPTRCAYCSFVAVGMKQLAKYLEKYVETLKNEISIIKNVVYENNFKVRAVYFGGGTPTSLPVKMLEDIILACDFNAREFTVEAGRPDTISVEMLDMLKTVGVTRISINPQTFHDKTLKILGRAHTVEDTLRAYDLARNYPMSVNMDLISALPGETYEDFVFSLDKTLSLAPDNITVHNLSLKRGSVLTESNYEATNYRDAQKMIDYSVATLENAGYEPYYMYRQKYNTGNLENSGYSVPRKECLYNVDIMEENCNILAAGAGAISKRLFKGENRIERLADVKDVKGYIERADGMRERHENFWKKR